MNFFYGKILDIFDLKKTPFRYAFSVAINVFLWDCMGKGACIKRMAAIRNYSTNTIMKKKKKGGEGRGLRIQNLVLISLGHFDFYFLLCQPQTHKTTV